MRTCAYCGYAKKLTREHLWPNSIIKANPDYRTFHDSSRNNLIHRSPPTIKDVCEKCNNETLAKLDKYGAKLERVYFSTFVEKPIKIKFQYSYHDLLRWLLKIFYNFARTQRINIENFKEFTPYILGRKEVSPYPITLMLGIIESSKKTPEELAGNDKLVGSQTFYFCDKLDPKTLKSGMAMVWRNTFKSYVFDVIFWEKDFPRNSQKQTLQSIPFYGKMKKLSPQRSNIEILEAFTDVRSYAPPRLSNRYL